MRRSSLCLLAAVVVVAACGGDDDDDAAAPAPTTTAAPAAVAEPSDELVDVGGHQLHLVCQGEGEPAVIVELGAGSTAAAWNGTQAELAADRQTCVYERAGHGDSEPGPEPRTAQRIADELDSLIEAAGIPTPLVLVSHSLGAIDTQAFAAAYPDLVAGIVFVDPRSAEYERRYREVMSPEEIAEDERILAQEIANEEFGPELAALGESVAGIEAGEGLPDVPVVVLTAGVPFPDQPQADIDLWRETHANLAGQVSDGRVQLVDDAEHEIWLTHSDAVVDAVAEVAG